MKESKGSQEKNDIHHEHIVHEILDHYDQTAEAFWESSRNHDIRQNYDTFLEAIPGQKPFDLLDFGCGPGRDLRYFKSLGHNPVGLDGSTVFCKMAHLLTGCEVMQQNFLKLELPFQKFDGIFANATLFHIPSPELPQVLEKLYWTLKPQGILFISNPRKREVVWFGKHHGSYYELEEFEHLLEATGLKILHHYFRPPEKPPEEQHWLAIVCQKQKGNHS